MGFGFIYLYVEIISLSDRIGIMDKNFWFKSWVHIMSPIAIVSTQNQPSLYP